MKRTTGDSPKSERLKLHRLIMGALLFYIFFPQNVHGQTQVQSPLVRGLVVENGYDQWLLWEQTANLPAYRRTSQAIVVPLVKVKSDDIKIQSSSDISEAVRTSFKAGRYVFWPKHPYNTDPSVPFFVKAPAKQANATLTASRSLALNGDLRGYTLKLATDHPHGENGEIQQDKVATYMDARVAIAISDHIKSVDEDLGPDKVFDFLPDILTMMLANSSVPGGVILRDVRMLDDGHYYLPAFSIPYVGREIAKLNGEEFGSFFQKNYARALGEAKARMLLRYGLQMETPNSQNMLLQLDRNLVPTGKIVYGGPHCLDRI